ncbi:MAG: hypothetical protein ACFE9S_01715 [Candidatus Hermodarchaeota archaeon]
MMNLELKKELINITRTKLVPKLIPFLAIGVLLLLFSTSVQACESKAIRPISDFTATNTNIAGWADPQTNLVAVPHGNNDGLQLENIADCTHYGFVLEEDLGDGRIKYKIFLYVKDAVVHVYNNEGTWWLSDPPGSGIYPQLVFTGKMDYYFSTTIIVEGVFGGPVPNLWVVWFFGGGEGLFSALIARGTGTLTQTGETGNVEITQIGILVDGVMEWPVETVTVG